MYPSEKRSLYRFLIIYLLSTFILFALGAYIFYTYEKHHIFDQQKQLLNTQGLKLRHQLMILHKKLDTQLPFVVNKPYQSVLFDIDKKVIFATYDEIQEPNISKQYYIQDTYLVHIAVMDPYYLGVAYLLVRTLINQEKINDIRLKILLFMFVAGWFFLIIGYFLGKIFISPMRKSIEMMNHFIQDTTHELNTPISTILTNLELIETLYKCPAKKEMKRIEIASKTLSRIYDDLTYLRLNYNSNKEIIALDMLLLIQERLLYFSASIESKGIELEQSLEEGVIVEIDRDDAIRLIDNLLSNAIKYNQIGGNLSVKMWHNGVSIKDSGIGIDPKRLKSIFERFQRANKSEGGFGIGLYIVDQIVQSYSFVLDIKSKLQEGTTVIIRW